MLLQNIGLIITNLFQKGCFSQWLSQDKSELLKDYEVMKRPPKVYLVTQDLLDML